MLGAHSDLPLFATRNSLFDVTTDRQAWAGNQTLEKAVEHHPNPEHLIEQT